MAKHAYWFILAGTTPTAFRAQVRDDLLPTLKQLQRTQPDAVLKWFERGKVWESPEQAADDARRRPLKRTSRTRDWRPGGNHADPRARFALTRDQKRARFRRRLRSPQAAGPMRRPGSGKPRKPRS
jgi:hypothetical protein